MGRKRNISLGLKYTQEEKQLMFDLANKLGMKLTDMILYLVRKEQENNEN